MNLPNKFKFKSVIKGMPKIIYIAIKAENSYVITWSFMGEDQSMLMTINEMDYHFKQKEYEIIL